jgi:hypothetical protein
MPRQPGSFEITFEPPDVVFVRVRGEIGAAEASALLAEIQQSRGRWLDLFELVDFSQVSAFTPEARMSVRSRCRRRESSRQPTRRRDSFNSML